HLRCCAQRPDQGDQSLRLRALPQAPLPVGALIGAALYATLTGARYKSGVSRSDAPRSRVTSWFDWRKGEPPSTDSGVAFLSFTGSARLARRLLGCCCGFEVCYRSTRPGLGGGAQA